jgi:hypothetical protein
MPERKRSFRYTAKAVAQIREFARRRMDAVRIADKMKCRAATVENICRKHSIPLVTLPDGAPPVSVQPGKRVRYAMVDVPIARDLLEKILAEANRRGTKPQHLIGRLAEVVARDDLFSAVFDDFRT